MTSSYNSYYKLNHGFIKERPSDTSSVDKKLRGMLERLRKERRQEFLKLQRTEGEEHVRPRGKSTSKGRHSKFIRDWKLSRAWSNELVEYRWLSNVSDGYRSVQDCPQEWLILPFCEGRRSMLIQGNGYCELRNQQGWKMFTVKNAPFSHNGLTIIDGIYNQDQNIFYCNDLIVWNNLNMCTSTTECRLHFLSCRIEESGAANRITVEGSDVCMKLNSPPKLVPSIRIQFGKYYPLSRDNLLKICVADDQLGRSPSHFDHLVFVRRDSMYEADQYCTHSTQRCQECCMNSQQGWFIWRDQEMSVFSCEEDAETETIESTFRLNVNEKNELYTKDGVLVGKVKGLGAISDSLSLDNDQKVLMNEYNLVFVKVKFGDKHILNALDLISSRNPLSSNDSMSRDVSLFEPQNVSSQDKHSSKLDSSDYMFFRCIELVSKAKRKNQTRVHEECHLNLNMESLLNSIS